MLAASPAMGAGGLACDNEPPRPDCTTVSPWITLSAGFGQTAGLTTTFDTTNGDVRTLFVAGGNFPYGKTLRFWHNSRDNRAYACGIGRNHLYGVVLLEHPSEWPATPVRIVLATGYRADFDENLDGTFRGAPGIHSRLYKDPDGSYRLYTNGTPDMANDGTVLNRFSPPDASGVCRLTSITDSLGTVSVYYVQSGNGVGEVARVVEDSTGSEAQFAYDTAGRLISVTSMNSVVTSFTYDANGDLSQVQSSWGTLGFGYDSNHNITLIHDGLGGHSASLAYGASARGIEFHDTYGSIYDFTYTVGDGDRVTSTTFGLRGASPSVYEITPNGLVASTSIPGTVKTCYTYDQDKCLVGTTQCGP